jgi:hypothetical protein
VVVRCGRSLHFGRLPKRHRRPRRAVPAQILRWTRARNGRRCNSVATVSPIPKQPRAAKIHAGQYGRSCSGWPRTVAQTENASAAPTALSRIPNLRHASRSSAMFSTRRRKRVGSSPIPKKLSCASAPRPRTGVVVTGLPRATHSPSTRGLWSWLWRKCRSTVENVAVHDSARDVKRFDAYRAALRQAVGADTINEPRSQTLKRHSLRRRKPDKTSK